MSFKPFLVMKIMSNIRFDVVFILQIRKKFTYCINEQCNYKIINIRRPTVFGYNTTY
jgi:hypothetical protein